MDISLLTYAIDSPDASYRIGDIIDVSLRHYEGCSNNAFVLVHVHGIPDTYATPQEQLAALKVKFEEPILAAPGEEVRRRAWRLAAEETAPWVMDELLATRETTIDWETAKVFLGKKVVSDIEDPDGDSIVFISDEDI